MSVSVTFTCRCCDCTTSRMVSAFQAMTGYDSDSRTCVTCDTCGGKCLHVRCTVAAAWLAAIVVAIVVTAVAL